MTLRSLRDSPRVEGILSRFSRSERPHAGHQYAVMTYDPFDELPPIPGADADILYPPLAASCNGARPRVA
jgi:hypothetical protein